MAKKSEVVVVDGFDYSPLSADVTKTLRSAAESIREKLKKTLEDIVAVGADLLAAKNSLDHGQFGRWLKAEFGWTHRTASNFMAVSERFGAKMEIISNLTIQPTAAYLLAAPSTPEKALETAIERAEAGEKITTKLAKEIVAKARKKRGGRPKVLSKEKLVSRLTMVLERYKERWKPDELTDLAQRLRDFADELEKTKRGSKK